MATTTVVGGDSYTFDLPPHEISAASQALNQFLSGWSPDNVVNVTTTTAVPSSGQLYIYQLTGGGTDNVPAGHVGVILGDDNPTTVSSPGMENLVIGNDANDAITISGDGTLYPGNGSELVGSGTVVAGDGNDTITVKGDANITLGDGNDSITVQLGNAQIAVGSGNDTITLGGPNDTVTAAGTATIAGPGSLNATIGAGGGQLFYQGGGGETVTAGSGEVTLAGGSNLTFNAGTGFTVMQATAGSGNDTFVGGSGFDTMTGGGSGNNVFAFDTGITPEGGTHVITNFSTGDQIQLGSGYNVSDIVNSSLTISGGSTTITLDATSTHPTVIILKGFTGLNTTDFK